MYHKHQCAYIDYIRNDRVQKAKEKEIDSVPDKIVRYFADSCLDTVQTEIKPRSNINHKLETINKKPKTRNYSSLKDIGKKEIEEVAERYFVKPKFVEDKLDDLENYCSRVGKRYKNYLSALRNFVKKDAPIPPNPVPKMKPLPKLSPEESRKAKKTVGEMRANLSNILAKKNNA